jgi:sugar phosphate isomerase/epimerase
VKVGISSYSYTWAIGVPGYPPERPLDAVGLLRKAVALGVGLVQFADNLPLHQLLPAELVRLEQAARDLDVSIEVGARGIAPGHLFAYLDLALRLGSPLVRVVVDTDEHQPSEPEIVDTLRSLMPAYERAAVCLAIENHDRFRARSLVRMIEQVDSPNVGICLDTVNSFGALEGPEGVVAELGPHVVNLHVKDFEVTRPAHKMGFAVEGRPAGQGRLDVPWLLETLRGMGRRPNAILELWTPLQDTLPETILLEDGWARESIAYLRGWDSSRGRGADSAAE